MRAREAQRDDMGDAGGQHPCLAGAGARKHEHGAIGRLHGLALFGVQPVEIAGRADRGGAGARRDAARPRRGGGDIAGGAAIEVEGV